MFQCINLYYYLNVICLFKIKAVLIMSIEKEIESRLESITVGLLISVFILHVLYLKDFPAINPVFCYYLSTFTSTTLFIIFMPNLICRVQCNVHSMNSLLC